MTKRITIRLNGTDTNPYERFGFTQNPFPQLADARYNESAINKLAAQPIPPDRPMHHIAEVLEGFSPELVELCQKLYEPGKVVEFDVTWEE